MKPLSVFLLLLFWLNQTLAQESAPLVANVFVAQDGDDSNLGIKDSPKATLSGAIEALRALRRSGDLTDKYQVNLWVRGGHYDAGAVVSLSSQDSGTAEKPFRIAAWKDEKVTFDGSEKVARNLFSVAKNPIDVARLSKEARGKVLVAVVPEGRAASALARPQAQLSFGSQMLQIARFPDLGFASFARVVKRDSGVANEVGTREDPKGATVTLDPAIPREWANEVMRSEKARLVGYISATWLKQSFSIASMDGGSVTMRDASAYGLPGRHGSRAYLENVLPALDRPGEWFYDTSTRQLFVWPPKNLSKGEEIGVWVGGDVFSISGAKHVRIENFIFTNFGNQNNGSGVVNIKSGSDNIVAGCVFRNIAPPMTAFNVSGTRNKILSCDVFDVGNASRLNGGSFDKNGFVPGENAIENCHFTQIYSTDFYGKVSGIGGAGNIFRNNLVHNHNGQIVTMSGVEHLVEKNEVFNTGIEEGDGGAFYQGAMMHSWGNTFRNNFFHHIMCVPEMYTRAAIFSDDGDCGDHVIGNVFYKAGEGFKSNVGSGHLAEDNLTIKGIHSFQFLSGRAETRYQTYTKYLGTNIGSGDKDNLIGKMLKVVGTDGWQNATKADWPDYVSPFWLERYPRMKKLFATWQKEKKVRVLNELRNNFAFDFDDRNPFAVPSFTVSEGNSNRKSMSSFKDPSKLDFSYKRTRPKWAPDIPFAKIGLYSDEFRPSPPEKDRYREAVNKFWRKENSAPPREYIARKVNKRSYFNTGKLVLGIEDSQ